MYDSASNTGKKKIVQSLFARIDKKREYRDVGYLIIFFLFLVGELKDGLEISLGKLQGDKANAFGDVLRLLDFLLAFRFEEFNESDLDAIEQFVYSTKEHPFKIKEKINTIQVKQMLDKKTS